VATTKGFHPQSKIDLTMSRFSESKNRYHMTRSFASARPAEFGQMRLLRDVVGDGEMEGG